MTDVIARDTQQLEQDAIVEMFELDLREMGEGILRFCSGPVDGHPVKFNGYSYQPVPVQAEGFKWDGQGTLPSPTLTLSVMEPTLASLIRQADDLVGAPITRIRTFRKYLDDSPGSDPQAKFPDEVFSIERKTKHNSQMAEFELAVSFDQRGKKIPGRQVLRDSCTHTYRRWDGNAFRYDRVSCPYTGDAYFKKFGGSTVFPAEDECGKRLKDCEKRFPGQTLPFYGFPGAGRL